MFAGKTSLMSEVEAGLEARNIAERLHRVESRFVTEAVGELAETLR